MKSLTRPSFWKAYDELDPRVRETVRKAYTLFAENPDHPSLRFKKLKGDLWSVRVGDHYRATGYFLTADTFVWDWIGTHEEYNKL